MSPRDGLLRAARICRSRLPRCHGYSPFPSRSACRQRGPIAPPVASRPWSPWPRPGRLGERARHLSALRSHCRGDVNSAELTSAVAARRVAQQLGRCVATTLATTPLTNCAHAWPNDCAHGAQPRSRQLRSRLGKSWSLAIPGITTLIFAWHRWTCKDTHTHTHMHALSICMQAEAEATMQADEGGRAGRRRLRRAGPPAGRPRA